MVIKQKRKKEPKCYDCGRPYGEEHGFPDLVIPSWAWKIISPKGNEGGLLCPSCLCKRLYRAKIKNIPHYFGSGPLTFEPRDWIGQKPPDHSGL